MTINSGVFDRSWLKDEEGEEIEPLAIIGKTPEQYRQTIQVNILDTQYKGCMLCGSGKPIHITSELAMIDLCPDCLSIIEKQIVRQLV